MAIKIEAWKSKNGGLYPTEKYAIEADNRFDMDQIVFNKFPRKGPLYHFAVELLNPWVMQHVKEIILELIDKKLI